MNTDILIIGGGPAGYAAALYAVRAGYKATVTEMLTVGGQMGLTGEVENYPGFPDGADGFTLGMNMQSQAEKFGAVSIRGEAESVDFSGKTKKVMVGGEEIDAKTVIIAVGAFPRRLGLDGEDALMGRGVHYCAHCDGRFYKGDTVVVVGGGNSAASDAIYLSQLAKKVILVHRRDTLRADDVLSAGVRSADNVEIMWNAVPAGYEIADGSLTGLRTVVGGDEKLIHCDAVFVSIGRQPATDFLVGKLELDKNGYIVADETTETSVDGVFAAGDVRTKPLRQIVTAVADGAVAAHFAAEYIRKVF